MTKYDANLSEAFIRLVPDDVTEEEFWRNFFYHIELWKSKNGFEHALGQLIDQTRRDEAVQEELKLAEQEIEKLKQDFPEEALLEANTDTKVVDETSTSVVVENSEIELQPV